MPFGDLTDKLLQGHGNLSILDLVDKMLVGVFGA